jgi:hypothetical protein
MSNAFRFSSPLGRGLGCAVLLCGLTACSWVPGRSSQTKSAPAWGAPAWSEVGRIIDYDATAGTALFEVPAHLAVPADLAGAALVVRNPATLAQTARVVVSQHRAGRIFGVYVIEGRPVLEDEVARPKVTFP